MKKIFTLAAITLICLGARSQAWVELGGIGQTSLGANYIIWALMSDPNANIYAAGGFTDSPTYIDGYSYVAKWNGTSWSPLGTGANALNAGNSIYALTQDAAGNIYAAGNFLDPNGRQYVARWNGTNWSEIGIDTMGLNALQPIYALTTDPAGNVYAAGAFTDSVFAYGHAYVAMWNGQMWTEVGLDTTAGLNADSDIYALACDRQGNIYAAGAFTDSLGFHYVAKWNDTVWTELGGTDSTGLFANGSINAMITDSAGNIYVGGTFTDTSGYYYIAKWNGHTWTELSNPANNQVNILGPINAITLDSVGNVYAGGMIPDSGGNFFFVVVWNGAQLLVADNSGSNPLYANNTIYAMCSDHYGNIYAAGAFTDTTIHEYVAEFTGNIPSGLSAVTPDHIYVYPNPSSGLVFIQADHLSGSAVIELLDGLGRTLYSQATDGTTIQAHVDVSAYAPGVYTLRIIDSQNTVMAKKIVKD